MYDFPNSPVVDDITTTPEGLSYTWDGTSWVMNIGGGSGAYVPLDGSLPMTGALMFDNGTQAWGVSHIGATRIGAFTITDWTATKERFYIQPGSGSSSGAIEIDSADNMIIPGGNLTVGLNLFVGGEFGAEIRVLGGITQFLAGGPAAQWEFMSGPAETAFGIYGTSARLFRSLWLDLDPTGAKSGAYAGMLGLLRFNGGAMRVIEGSDVNNDVWFGPQDATAFIIREDGVAVDFVKPVTFFGEPDPDVAGTFHDATLRLTANTQAWDLIGATPDSGSAPGAFILADATTGTRRLIIDPGATDSATAVQITNTGDLLVNGVPVGGGGGLDQATADTLYVNALGDIMTGQLQIIPPAGGVGGLIIDHRAISFSPAINLTTTAGSWSVSAHGDTMPIPGIFSITDLGSGSFSRFEVHQHAGVLPPPPVIIDADGALFCPHLIRFDAMVAGGSAMAGDGPFIWCDAFDYVFRSARDDSSFQFQSFSGNTSLSIADNQTLVQRGQFMVGSGDMKLYSDDDPATTGYYDKVVFDLAVISGHGWHLSTEGASGTVPDAFTIADRPFGATPVITNRFIIQAGAGPAVEISAAGAVEAPGGFTVLGVPIGDGGGLDQATADTLYANIGGDTFTGPVLLAGAPTLPLHAATMGWVESVIGAAGGGTITGVTAGPGLTGGGVTGGVTLSLTVPVTIAMGGTGAITAPLALAALGGLDQATADTLYLDIATDLFTQAEADLLYMPLASDFLTQAEADARYLNISTGDYLTTAEGAAAYLPITTDLFTQAEADLLYLPIATDLLTQVEADARYLGLAGGTLTGPLVLSGPPTLALHAATMAYVDAAMGAGGGGTITGVTAGAGLTGGGVTGTVTLGLTIPVAIASGGTNAIDAATALTNLGGISQTAADARYLGIATDLFTQAEADLLYMPIASDFLTQAEADLLYLTPAAAAAAYLPITTDLFTQAEADALFLTPAEGAAAYLPITTDLFTQTEADARYLGLAGGTLTGALVLSGPPTLALHAATMAYVDAQVGGGLTQAEADLLYLPITTDLFTQAEADALFLTPAEGAAAYLPITTDLFTQAEADLLYMPIASDFLTQAEGDARYLAIATDLFTQAEADALFLTPAEGNAAYLPIATDLFTQAEADVLYKPIAEPTIATVADAAPATPVQGQVWFDSANVRLCVWFNDGTSSQWVVV